MHALLALLLLACPSDPADDDDTATDDDDATLNDDDAANDDDAVDDDDAANDDDAVDDDDATPGDRSESTPGCDPLAAPTGTIVDVTPSDVSTLRQQVSSAAEGTTFRFAAGTYPLNGEYLWIATPGIRLVGAGATPEDVVLDGNYQTTEIVTVAASDVTVDNLTLYRAGTHGVHVVGGSDGSIVNTRLHDIRVVDPGEQAIKINQSGTNYADDGELSCSTLLMTDAGRPNVSGCYTGGVDAHQSRGWLVRDNYIEGFWCDQGLSEHGIHFWRSNADHRIERNTIVDCARGIGLGLASSAAGDERTYPEYSCGVDYVGDYWGIVRNNMVFASRQELFDSAAGFDSGVSVWAACEAVVLHNTVVSTSAPFTSIEWRFPQTTGAVRGNVVSHNLAARDNTAVVESGNLDSASMDWFVDAAAGDLHLLPNTPPVDAGTEDLLFDHEGQARDASPDLGADELD